MAREIPFRRTLLGQALLLGVLPAVGVVLAVVGINGVRAWDGIVERIERELVSETAAAVREIDTRNASSTGLVRMIALAQESQGGRLYAPLWLDCDPGRSGRPLTWRQLTVADTRQNLPRHQAAGFRVQVGLDQWLLYRALDQPRNRTVLGCNLSCEFLLGRVRPDGTVARTLEIE